jgi:hypothetical protein
VLREVLRPLAKTWPSAAMSRLRRLTYYQRLESGLATRLPRLGQLRDRREARNRVHVAVSLNQALAKKASATLWVGQK